MISDFLPADWMSANQQRIAAKLAFWLSQQSPVPELQQAMRYATVEGGKRLRALLVYAAGMAVLTPEDALDEPACAVEMMHAYSLIHDDMPMMDDDDLRRGRPSCHKAYSEATALLAGDALQTLAFSTLAESSKLSANQKVAMIRTLAYASGLQGMAGGQAIDLAAVGQTLDLAALEQMHLLKTGALIRASVTLGALANSQISDAELAALDHYAAAIGLAFQVQDDVLDVTADTATLGKQQGADIAKGKPTYPALLGLEGARKKAESLVSTALDCLNELPGDTRALAALAGFVVQRKF